MRRYVKTALVLLLFIGALIFLLRQGPERGQLHLWKLDVASIQSLRVRSPKVRYRLERIDGSWHLLAGENGAQAVKPEAIQARLSVLRHPHAKSVLGGDKNAVGDYRAYGLEPATTEIQIELLDHTKVLLIGNKTPLQDNYYVRVAGEPGIYLFSIYDFSSLLSEDLDSLIQKTPDPVPPG